MARAPPTNIPRAQTALTAPSTPTQPMEASPPRRLSRAQTIGNFSDTAGVAARAALSTQLRENNVTDPRLQTFSMEGSHIGTAVIRDVCFVLFFVWRLFIELFVCLDYSRSCGK